VRKISLEELVDALDYSGVEKPLTVGRSLLTILGQRGWQISDVPGPRDDPMPVFPLLAKDVLAPGTIDYYRRECERHNLPEQAAQVAAAYREAAAWQERHPELCKLPDHQHVPARTLIP
jgi:hypothetical protein